MKNVFLDQGPEGPWCFLWNWYWIDTPRAAWNSTSRHDIRRNARVLCFLPNFFQPSAVLPRGSVRLMSLLTVTVTRST